MASPTSPGDDRHFTSPAPAWHFPGPSTKYHSSERPKKHTRNSSSFTPRAPNLATERRSHHRRAHTGLPSPPSTASDYSQSPLSRFGGVTGSMAPQHQLPTTPAKGRRGSSVFHSSPYSDYFTDPDARSIMHLDDPASASSSSTATQQLLVRMNKLQSQLIHDPTTSPSPDDPPLAAREDVIAIVGRNLTRLEHDLSTLTTQSRYAPELTDSGLFLHTEDYPLPSSAASSTSTSSSSNPGTHQTHEDPTLTISHLRAERDYFLLETQRLLAGLRSAQASLRHRYDDLRDLHARQAEVIARVEVENAGLSAENAELRADLAGDAGELLFLKVVLQGLRARVEGKEKGDGAAWGREMENWRLDWTEVEERFRRRRGRYESSCAEDGGVETGEGAIEGDEEKASWGLEMSKTVDGRVTSVTIKRVGREGVAEEEQSAPEEESAPEEVRKEYAEQGTQTEDMAPVSVPDLEEQDADASSDDCAITTSSEPALSDSEETESDVIEEPKDDEIEEVKVDAPTKSPWQELWDGLTKLANMDDSRF